MSLHYVPSHNKKQLSNSGSAMFLRLRRTKHKKPHREILKAAIESSW